MNPSERPSQPWPSPRSSRAGRRWLALVVVVLLTGVLTVGPAMGTDGVALADPGPYEVLTSEVSVPRTRGGEGDFAARLYVPLPRQPGTSEPPSAVVAFGHGYQVRVDDYESTLAHLASWGIVVIAPRSAGELFPDHAAFADDLLSSLDWVVAAARPGSPDWPGGPVDPEALGLSGHSMGGGAALLATAREPAIRTVATLAAAETDPSAIGAAGAIAAPVLFVAASDDAITPVAEHQRPMFEAKAVGPAELRTIVGASHCGFLDAETLLLSLVCDDAAIGPDEQRRVTRAVLAAWLRHELAGDASAAALAWPDASDGATLVETR